MILKVTGDKSVLPRSLLFFGCTKIFRELFFGQFLLNFGQIPDPKNEFFLITKVWTTLGARQKPSPTFSNSLPGQHGQHLERQGCFTASVVRRTVIDLTAVLWHSEIVAHKGSIC